MIYFFKYYISGKLFYSSIIIGINTDNSNCAVYFMPTELLIFHSPWQCCLWKRRKCGCPLRIYIYRRWEQYDLSECLWGSYHWQSIKHKCVTTIQSKERSNTLLPRLRKWRSCKHIEEKRL